MAVEEDSSFEGGGDRDEKTNFTLVLRAGMDVFSKRT
jgi:hypothetical protein